MKEIDGLWFPTRWKLIENLAREMLDNAADWELAIPHIKGWGCAIDGGANVGAWTRRLAERFAVVHAFEPDANNFECLEKNTAHLPNVIRHRLALGKCEGSCEMMGQRSPSRHVGPGSGIRVVPLDHFKLEADFIKLDIEGSESLALQGAVETLKRWPVVMLEDKYFSRYGDPHPITFLRGYRQVAAIHRDKIYTHDGA